MIDSKHLERVPNTCTISPSPSKLAETKLTRNKTFEQTDERTETMLEKEAEPSWLTAGTCLSLSLGPYRPLSEPLTVGLSPELPEGTVLPDPQETRLPPHRQRLHEENLHVFAPETDWHLSTRRRLTWTFQIKAHLDSDQFESLNDSEETCHLLLKVKYEIKVGEFCCKTWFKCNFYTFFFVWQLQTSRITDR